MVKMWDDAHSCSPEYLNAMLARNKQLALAHCNPIWVVELACSIAFPAPLPLVRAVQTEHLHAMVIVVGHKHFFPTHNHTKRTIELTIYS